MSTITLSKTPSPLRLRDELEAKVLKELLGPGSEDDDCLLALGENVSSVASVYYWPQDNRARDENGKIGVLHVKCAVADEHCLFLAWRCGRSGL